MVAKWHSTSRWVSVTSPFIFFHLGISLLAHLQLVLRLNDCLWKGYLGITVSGYLLISSCFLPTLKLGGIVAGYRNLRLWSFSLRCYPTLWVLQVWGRRPSWWGFLHMPVGGEAVWEAEGTVSTSAVPMHNSRRHQPHRRQIRLFPASATLLYLPSLGTGGWYSHRFLHRLSTELKASLNPTALKLQQKDPRRCRDGGEHEDTGSGQLAAVFPEPSSTLSHRTLGARLAWDVSSRNVCSLCLEISSDDKALGQ